MAVSRVVRARTRGLHAIRARKEEKRGEMVGESVHRFRERGERIRM